MTTQPRKAILPRVEKIDFNGQAAWLKRAEAAPPRWRYAVLDFVARRLDLQLAAAVRKPGQQESLRIERKRIAALRALGIEVPAVLAESDDWHLLSHIGRPLRQEFSERNTAGRLELAGALLQTLEKIHSGGEYLSQAFLRNMLYTPAGDIGFIDFEEDPGSHLPVHCCQARDILMATSGLSDYLDFTSPEVIQLFDQFLQNHDCATRALLAGECTRLARPLKLLEPVSGSREVRRLLAAAALITSLSDSAELAEPA